jgi:hypothetical protein
VIKIENFHLKYSLFFHFAAPDGSTTCSTIATPLFIFSLIESLKEKVDILSARYTELCGVLTNDPVFLDLTPFKWHINMNIAEDLTSSTLRAFREEKDEPKPKQKKI